MLFRYFVYSKKLGRFKSYSLLFILYIGEVMMEVQQYMQPPFPVLVLYYKLLLILEEIYVCMIIKGCFLEIGLKKQDQNIIKK